MSCARLGRFGRAFPTRGDKSVRAQSIRGRIGLNGLYVPTLKPWWPDVRAELLAFPAGRHDDIVDALGLIGQLLDKMVKGIAPDKKIILRGEAKRTEMVRLRDISWKGSYDRAAREAEDQPILWKAL
jgi:hypothetical protein